MNELGLWDAGNVKVNELGERERQRELRCPGQSSHGYTHHIQLELRAGGAGTPKIVVDRLYVFVPPGGRAYNALTAAVNKGLLDEEVGITAINADPDCGALFAGGLLQACRDVRNFERGKKGDLEEGDLEEEEQGAPHPDQGVLPEHMGSQ